MTEKNNFNFTLVLSGVDEHTKDLEDTLFDAGCDDALINFRNGVVYLDFDREAVDFEDAVISAIKQVESTPLQLAVVSVAPDDYVTESEVAKRLHINRQAVSLWFKRERHTKNPFPSPVMRLTEKSPLWRWSDIVDWLYQKKKIKNVKMLEHAKFIGSINIALIDRNAKIKRYRQKILKKLGSGNKKKYA